MQILELKEMVKKIGKTSLQKHLMEVEGDKPKKGKPDLVTINPILTRTIDNRR